METSLIFTVALAAAIIVIVLALVAVIVFQRWRINDSNAHLKEFIDENMELRRKIRKAGILQPCKNLLTGNFTYTDHFDSATLNNRWLFLRSPKGDSIRYCRQQHANFTAETELKANKVGGVILFQNEQYNIIFTSMRVNGQPSLVLKRTEKGDEQQITTRPIDITSELKLKVEACGRYYSFYFQQGTAVWQTLATGVDGANLSTARAGGFVGAMIGLFSGN